MQAELYSLPCALQRPLGTQHKFAWQVVLCSAPLFLRQQHVKQTSGLTLFPALQITSLVMQESRRCVTGASNPSIDPAPLMVQGVQPVRAAVAGLLNSCCFWGACCPSQ